MREPGVGPTHVLPGKEEIELVSRIYRAAVVGCSRMGAFIDNEFVGLPGRYAPHSHAAGYEACDRTDLVAGVDMRPDVLAQFGQRYGVAESHLYTDYREMLAKEQPDIISVATQPEQRAEIAIYAAEHGVKALYCEKAMCASLQEADAMSRPWSATGSSSTWAPTGAGILAMPRCGS